MVEMVCEKSWGAVAIEAWRPGGQTAGHKADVPKVRSSRHGAELFLLEVDKTERVPVEPDALFTLRFKDGPEEWLVLDPIWALPDQSMHALGTRKTQRPNRTLPSLWSIRAGYPLLER